MNSTTTGGLMPARRDLYHHSRTLSLTPAPPGWRVVYAIGPPDGKPLDDCGPSDILLTDPVACFAIVEEWESSHFDDAEPSDGAVDVIRLVVPLVRGDGVLLESGHDVANSVALIGPDEPVEQSFDAAVSCLRDRAELRAKRGAAGRGEETPAA
jgi:hypothetical protein